MPMWLTILFTIIGNLPTIIKTIKEIIDLLKKKSPAEAEAAKAELKQAVMDCSKDKDHARLLVRLEALMARLRAR